MLGHIEQWFYSGLGGIRVDMAKTPGRQLEIRPSVPENLQWVHTSYDSVLGKIVSNWRRVGHRLILRFIIPPATAARVYVPTNDSHTIRINHHLLTGAGMRVVRIIHDRTIVEVPSGNYRCTCQYRWEAKRGRD